MTQTRFLRRHAADILISLVLFVGALVIRRPHLMLLPAFSDESLEVRWAMDIALGRRLPLTAYDSYYGPLFPYLIAGAFKVFGVGLTVPRTVIMVFGSLTASAAFWCGRVVSGRWTGAIAGCLVAVSPALVLYSSHYGWSNSLTPCFSILAVTCLYLGVQRENRRALAIGGALVALTLQTHPLTVVGWAGAAFWLIHSRRRYPWLTSYEVARCAVFFAIGYSPMLLANVLTPATSLRLAVQRTYAFAPTVDPAEYTRRLVDLLTTLVDMLAGGLAVERFPAIPAAFVVAAAVLMALVVADWVRGTRLISCIIISTILLMPWAVKLFMPRYLAFLLPISFVAAASLLVTGVRAALESQPPAQQRMGAVMMGVAGVIMLAAALWYPSRLLERYSNWALANGLSNDAYFRLLGVVSDQHACGPQLLVEEVGRPLVNPAWVGLYAVDHVLSLSGCEHALLTIEQAKLRLEGGEDGWAVLSIASVSQFSEEWHLRSQFLFGAPAGFERVPIGLYRIARRHGP